MRFAFADRTVSYEQFLEDVSRRVASIISKQQQHAPQEEELVSAEDAARMLHITPDRLRRIKDKFDYVKQGDNKQGRLLFKKSELVGRYIQQY